MTMMVSMVKVFSLFSVSMFHIWMSIALLLALVGLLGSVLPVLPGTVFSLVAMLLVEFATPIDFSSMIWAIVGVLIVASVVSDYVFPLLWARQWWGTKAGTRWSIVGMIVWFVVPPRGLIFWPIIGAFVGEYLVKKNARHARRAAWGSFLGSTASTVIKLIAAGMVLWYVVAAWV